MQVQGISNKELNQESKTVCVGIDMGGSLWAVNYNYWDTKKSSYKGYKGEGKEERIYSAVTELIRKGFTVHVFYEAGRYGFAPARRFTDIGAEVTIIPVNKLKVISYGKQAKTDKIDAKFLSELIPDKKLPSVYVPTPAEEDRRNAVREKERLSSLIGSHNNKMLAIIERSQITGITKHRSSNAWKFLLDDWKKQKNIGPHGILPLDYERLKNHCRELALAEEHLKRWEKMMLKQEEKDREEAAKKSTVALIDQLRQFRGIGEEFSRTFAWEIGDLSRFSNGRKFSSYFGLTPTPWASGNMNREQGISKAGRNSLRRMAIEMAWCWTRWQPDSALSLKWKNKLAHKGRARKTAIVALARQLMVALYRLVVHGQPIEGALINCPIEV